MNPDTGHLVNLDSGPYDDLLLQGYHRLPRRLAAEAEAALAGQSETYINLDVPSPLSQWAADQRRRQAKKKARARARRKARKRRKRR